MRLSTIVVTVILLAAGTALATPHGKPGLWIITSTMKMANMPQIPPEALAAMKARGMKIPGSGDENCTPHVVSQTANSITTDIVCHGTMEGTGRSQISWRGDSHYEGSYEFKGAMHGQPNQISTHYTGDFVKADCGSVKPFKAPPSQH
jgi:hypothetical protein